MIAVLWVAFVLVLFVAIQMAREGDDPVFFLVAAFIVLGLTLFAQP